MSAFYFHADMQDMAALKIRTPDFNTHEEAEQHYHEKRLEKYEARARRRILYSVLVIIGIVSGLYRWYLQSKPETMSQFAISFITGALSMALALTLCTKGMLWLWDIIQEWDEVEDDNGKKEVTTIHDHSMV
jgi:hypothetical protein